MALSNLGPVLWACADSMRGSMGADEYKDYLLMTYSMLKDKSILNIGDLDDNDETLAKWNDGSISFNELLDYAITKDIVNISALNLESDYLDTNEI